MHRILLFAFSHLFLIILQHLDFKATRYPNYISKICRVIHRSIHVVDMCRSSSFLSFSVSPIIFGYPELVFIVHIQEGPTLDVRCKCTPDGYFEYHSFARNSNILWILLSLSFSFPHFTTLVNLIAYIPF